MNIPLSHLFAQPENITGGVELFTYVNDVLVGGWFGVGLLFAIFCISFIAMRADTKAFISSMTITTMACIFISTLGWIDPNLIIVTSAITAVSIFFLKDSI